MAEKDSEATKADSTRSQIVAAAKKRFTHFGYGKTTMAEVAADCDMSPGNLYRFFPGKLDIAEAIATADYKIYLDHLRRQTARPGRRAGEKLHDFLSEGLRRTYTKQEKDPRGFELARVIAAERPAFAAWMLECERAIMVGVMEEAEQAGEFDIADKNFTAELIQSATMKFRNPQFWSKLSLSRLERELDGVWKLLVEGLMPKPVRTRKQEIA
jgi:AcrR family transcriptional regulator